MTHGRYAVTGPRQYRGHRPGEIFEARLDRFAERRAVARGSIRLLEHVEPSVADTEHRLPEGWPPPAADTAATEAPEGASSMFGGGKK